MLRRAATRFGGERTARAALGIGAHALAQRKRSGTVRRKRAQRREPRETKLLGPQRPRDDGAVGDRSAHLRGPKREIARGRGVVVRAVERDPGRQPKREIAFRRGELGPVVGEPRARHHVRSRDPDESRMVALDRIASRLEPSAQIVIDAHARRERREGLGVGRHGDRLVTEVPQRLPTSISVCVGARRYPEVRGWIQAERSARADIRHRRRSAELDAWRAGGDLADHGGMLEALGTE